MLNHLIKAAMSGDKAAMARVESGRFVRAEALGEARSQHALGADEAPLVAVAMNCSLLILDDLGKEDRRKREAVVQVLRTRHVDERPTIVTTELGPDAIVSSYASEGVDGTHLMRRLFTSPAIPIEVLR